MAPSGTRRNNAHGLHDHHRWVRPIHLAQSQIPTTPNQSPKLLPSRMENPTRPAETEARRPRPRKRTNDSRWHYSGSTATISTRENLQVEYLSKLHRVVPVVYVWTGGESWSDLRWVCGAKHSDVCAVFVTKTVLARRCACAVSVL